MFKISNQIIHGLQEIVSHTKRKLVFRIRIEQNMYDFLAVIQPINDLRIGQTRAQRGRLIRRNQTHRIMLKRAIPHR